MDDIEPLETKSYKNRIHVVLYLAAPSLCWWLCFQLVRWSSFHICPEHQCIFLSSIVTDRPHQSSSKVVLYQLLGIKSVWRALPIVAAIQLMNSFIISLVDYYNSILAAAPLHQMDRIQSILIVVVRLIYGRGHFDQVSDLIRDRLHWFHVPQRISFKCTLLAYKAQHGLVPILQLLSADVISPAPLQSMLFNLKQSCHLKDQDQVRWTFIHSSWTEGLALSTRLSKPPIPSAPSSLDWIHLCLDYRILRLTLSKRPCLQNILCYYDEISYS